MAVRDEGLAHIQPLDDGLGEHLLEQVVALGRLHLDLPQLLDLKLGLDAGQDLQPLEGLGKEGQHANEALWKVLKLVSSEYVDVPILMQTFGAS